MGSIVRNPTQPAPLLFVLFPMGEDMGWCRPYIYNALKTLRQAHSPIWSDGDVKNVHYIRMKPWEEKSEEDDVEDTHAWWWEVDEERRMIEREAGYLEPDGI